MPAARSCSGARSSAPVLELVPARRGEELEQRAAAVRVREREVLPLVVPAHLEQALLYAVVEPRAAKDELLEPVDKRFAADEGESVPVANEILAERAARCSDRVALDELDEIAGLVLVQLGARDETQTDRRGRDAFFEIQAVEGEAVPEELDDVVVARGVIPGRFHGQSVPCSCAGTPLPRGSGSRVGARQSDGLGAVLAVGEGGLTGTRDRRRRRRRRRSCAPLGEGRAQFAAGVPASAACARVLAARPRPTRAPDVSRRQAPERGRLTAGRSRRVTCSRRELTCQGRAGPRGADRGSRRARARARAATFNTPSRTPTHPGTGEACRCTREKCVAARSRMVDNSAQAVAFGQVPRPIPSAPLRSLVCMHEGTWTLADCPPETQAQLARTLGISEVTAAVLVRRGYSDPATARRFLDGEQAPHDPFLLGDMEAACAQIRAAVEQRRRICVHGDYDVDGIAATTLAVLLLGELGADVAWHLPSRFDEGYGVRSETLARLADEGCGLVLTVDCGITAVAEVAAARERGLDVVVTDHHRPGEALPDCPIVATRPSAYPFPELCGTGVVYKLGQALFGVDSEIPKRHLDLVALATIADVVPLVDENRSLAIAGLRALARTSKPGLRALMRAAGVDAASLDAGSVGFRLAPRLNAAGRLGHPREALELLLTEDENEARRLADSLEELNKERQAVEGRILREAIAQVEAWPPEQRARRAYAVAGADWHEGVIGIVASRLVERYNRPVVLVAGSGDERDWKGSGRSITAFDLHGALGACSNLLGRWGGHRAAAGLSIEPENVDAFAAAFASHAESALDESDLDPATRIDAIVGRDEPLSLDLCAELARLAPFGLGNPAPTLLAAGVGVAELATVGEGKHLRFRVRRDGRDAGSAIAFGQGSRLEVLRPDALYDVAFRLEENHWNGTVAPQLVVRRIFGATPRYRELRAWLAAEWKKPESARDAEAVAIFDELRIVEGGPRRDLLESARFRGLLAAEPPLAAAA